MNPISDLTYKVAAFSEIEAVRSDDFVDWAIDMLQLGHDSQSLILLAGLSKPTNFFESRDLLIASFSELNLQLKTNEDGIISFSKGYVESIANKSEIRKNLNILKDLCIGNDYENSIFDFYSLYFCWDVFDSGEDQQGYWETTPGTIEETVIDRAKKWMKENENHYAQQGL
jgi:hypothetical protein